MAGAPAGDRINLSVFSIFQWNSHIHICNCAYSYSTGNFCNQGHLRTFLCDCPVVSNIAYTNYSANPPLKKFYTFLFVDFLYVTLRREYETKSCAVYVILGYDVNGIKDILGLWISESEGKHTWMQIFDEIKARGVGWCH